MIVKYFFRLLLNIIVFSPLVIYSQWTEYNLSNTSLPINNATSVNVSNSGVLWIGTFNSGVIEFDGTNWNLYNHAGVGGSFNDYINNIYVDGNSPWLSTQYGGIESYNGSVWSTITSSAGKLPENDVTGISFDSKGVMWVATSSSGLAKDSQNIWTIYNTTSIPSLPINNLNNLYIDAQDNKWISTSGAGLIKLTKNKVLQTYNTSNSNIPSNNIFYVANSPDGNLWVCTDAGVGKFDGVSTWTIYNKSNTSGVIPNDSIMEVAFDNTGDAFFATNGGLVTYVRGSWYNFTTSNSNIPENNLTGIAINPLSNNDVWVSMRDSGLAMIAYTVLPVLESSSNIESTFTNFPNPASDQTNISYHIQNTALINLSMYDMLGNNVSNIVNESQNEGTHSYNIDVSNYSPGLYLCRLQVDNNIFYRKCLIVK